MQLLKHRVQYEARWHCLLDEQQAVREIREALVVKGATFEGELGNYRSHGGNALVYRLVGSRSSDHQRWMPWRGTIKVDATGGGGSAIDLRLQSAQGFYIYQGEPTREKWRSLLDAVAGFIVTATGSVGEVIYGSPVSLRPSPPDRTRPKTRR